MLRKLELFAKVETSKTKAVINNNTKTGLWNFLSQAYWIENKLLIYEYKQKHVCYQLYKTFCIIFHQQQLPSPRLWPRSRCTASHAAILSSKLGCTNRCQPSIVRYLGSYLIVAVILIYKVINSIQFLALTPISFLEIYFLWVYQLTF